MDLAQYLNATRISQREFGVRIGVSQTRVSQILSDGAPVHVCPAIEAATSGQVRCEEQRPDVIWTRDPETGQVTGYTVPVATAEPKAA